MAYAKSIKTYVIVVYQLTWKTWWTAVLVLTYLNVMFIISVTQVSRTQVLETISE